MKKKLVDYQDGYRVVSIAKNERVRDDLLDDQIGFLYVTEKTVILYPEQKCLSESSEVIELLFASNNYDVYEIWDNGTLTRYYDDSSIDNYFFLTSKCNSNCIMCPSSDHSRKEKFTVDAGNLIEIAKHIPIDTPHLTITGGEPFMMGNGIFTFLSYLRNKFESTEFLILTNGRIFSVDSYAERTWEVLPVNSIVAIPIHASRAEIHDRITQTDKSFIQTVCGIKNLLKRGIKVELRIVISRLNAENLSELADMIISEFSGVSYVSIIAMEMTGNAYKNRETVWIPYRQAAKAAEPAVMKMIRSGIDVKLYNFPLCTVKKSFWPLCEKSISPYKVRYGETCAECRVHKVCGGVFAGTISMEKGELEAIT